MSRTANKFTNPLNNDSYEWEINHSEESETSAQRAITHGANTANTGLVKQQSDDQPLTFQYTGTILSEAQVTEMISWYLLCATQTIYFTDFAGDEYEVLITAFKPTRHRTIKNPKDFANAPLWYWTYTIEIEVVRVISGIWTGVVA